MLRPVLRGGGDVGSSHPPTHYVSISDSNQTAVQLQVPAEDGTDGETAEPPPEVAEGATPWRSFLSLSTTGVMGAVTPYFTSCAPFLPEEDVEGGHELEVMVRFLS